MTKKKDEGESLSHEILSPKESPKKMPDDVVVAEKEGDAEPMNLGKEREDEDWT